jgi:aminopeptidase N
LHLRLELSIDDAARTVSGTAFHRLTPINDGLKEIVFDEQDLHVRGVRDESGRALAWEAHGGTLLVRLAKPRKAGEAFELRIRYSCSPRKGLYFTAPDNAYPDKPSTVWTQGEEMDNRSWFPCYDFPNEKFTTEIVITVNERFKAVANGRLISEKHDRDKGTRTFHWLQDKPHPNYLVGLVVGEWDMKEWEADGVPVLAYVPKGRGKDIDLCFSRVPEMVRFYGRVTGLRFPWDKYAQACVPEFIFGAMENTTITIMDDACLTDERAYPDYNSDATLSHELVHHWFGDWITCKSFGHVWLKEGFANYFECLWWEERYGKDEFLVHLEEMRRHYFEEAEKEYLRPIVTHTFVDAKEMFDAHTYDKGAAVLHMLRYLLGDELWWKGIRAYVAAHGTSAVETADFKMAMEQATGRTLDGFFEQWLYRPGHPEFKVSWSWDPRARQAEVRVTQTQETKDRVPVFKVPVTLEFASDDRVWRESLQLEKADHSFLFSCRERPKAILFDPDGALLKRLVFPRSTEELRWVLTHSGSFWSRLEACAQLGRTGEAAETVSALEERLCEDPRWAVRRAAATALGEAGTPAARDALLRLVTDQDSRVRVAIYEALGHFVKDELAFGALARAYREDGKYYPMAAAAAALGSTRHARAFDTLVAGMDPASHAEVIASRAADGLAALGDERGVDVLSWRTRYGEPEMRRYAMAIALGRLGRVVEGRRMDVMEHLIGLTKDRNLRTKLGAIEGLGELGSFRAIPALERIVEGEVLWSFKKRARRALRRIRRAETERAPLLEQQKALDSLDEERLKLARRVATLESRIDALRRPRRR